jgi:hypothetical protein
VRAIPEKHPSPQRRLQQEIYNKKWPALRRNITPIEKNKNRVYNPELTKIIVTPRNTAVSYNTIHPLRDEVARDAKREQTSSNAPEPSQVALVLLARHPDVHAPHTGNDVHGQDDGSEDCEFAEDVGGLLGAFVHADVDLGEVIAVGAGEEAVRVLLVLEIDLKGDEDSRTSRNDSGCLSWSRCGLGCRPSTDRSLSVVQLPSARCSAWRSP